MTLAGGLAFSERGGWLGHGRFADGFPFSIPLVIILGIHELGHYAQCRRYGIAATLPYFLPSPFLFPPFFLFAGTFGALIRIKEPLRDRNRLVDVGAAGPLAGFVAAIPFLVYGVGHATPYRGPQAPGTYVFGYPPIVKILQHLPGLHPYSSLQVTEGPVFMAGWFACLVTALNLLPIGQLDGGHVLRAVAGRRQPAISRVVVLASLAVAWWSPTWAFFCVIASFMVGIGHPPIDNEAEPLGRSRWIAAAVCLVVLLLCLPPIPVSQIP